jgi:hypothetical protein
MEITLDYAEAIIVMAEDQRFEWVWNGSRRAYTNGDPRLYDLTLTVKYVLVRVIGEHGLPFQAFPDDGCDCTANGSRKAAGTTNGPPELVGHGKQCPIASLAIREVLPYRRISESFNLDWSRNERPPSICADLKHRILSWRRRHFPTRSERPASVSVSLMTPLG